MVLPENALAMAYAYAKKRGASHERYTQPIHPNSEGKHT